MPNQPAPHTVFVSHAHADNELCDRYVATLRARGLDVWYDRTNMQDGHMLNAEIEAQLEARTAFVVLLTPASMASYWVNLEVSAFRSLAAQDPKRLMLPVRIAECKVPLLMAGIKWIDAVTLGFNAAVDAMAAVLLERVAGYSTKHRANQPIPARTPTRPNMLVMRLLAMGKALYDQEQYDEAYHYFERASQRDPNNAEAWWHLGNINTKFGRTEGALYAYEHVLSLDPYKVEAWICKSRILFEMKRYGESLDVADHALDLNPTLDEAWACKGDALKKLRRYEEALTAYKRALTHNAELVTAWHGKGETLQALGRKKEALIAYDRAFELDPYNVEEWVSGEIERDEWNYRREERLEKANQSLTTDQDSATAWVREGEALCVLSRNEEALAAFEHALILDSRDVRAWIGKGDILFDQRNEYNRSYIIPITSRPSLHEQNQLARYEEQALAAYDQAVAIEPSCVGAWLRKGKLLIDLSRYEEALAPLDRALALDVTDGGVWWHKCMALEALHRLDEALAVCDKAIAVDLRSSGIWFEKARLLKLFDRDNEALAAYEQAAELDPTSPMIWEEKGDMLERLSRYEEALTAFDHALALAPNSFTTWDRREEVLRKLGRNAEAEMAADRSRAVGPQDPEW